MRVREVIRVIGIDCPTCIYSIQRSLSKLDGFISLNVDTSSGEAIVEYDDEKLSLGSIYKAILDAGYDIVKERVILSIRDISDEEYSILESKLKSIKGVIDCNASPVTGLVSVVFNPLSVGRDKLLDEARRLGVEFEELKELEAVSLREKTGLLLARRLATFSIGLFTVVYAMLWSKHSLPRGHGDTLLLAILSAVTVLLGIDIVIRGFKSLIKLAPSMNTLIALSSLTSLISGISSYMGLLRLEGVVHTESFFEASAGVMGFISLGLYLEERLRRRALSSLEELAKTLVSSVRVVEKDRVVVKSADSVAPGEVIEVRSGEVVPLDGVVVEGWGYVDESSFTGEHIPRLKRADTRDPVLAGSILVNGYLKVRVTRATRDTLLYRIIETVREAQFYKPRVIRVADKVVGSLVWIVIGIAVSTLLYWWLIAGKPSLALLFSASVLVVACPCALGIAVPMVISIAVLKTARRGMLVRRGDVFERLNEATMVFFDKTGTLTIGKPSIRGVNILDYSISEDQLLYLVCSVESRSEHPLSKAFISYCIERGVRYDSPVDYINFPGLGVIGSIGNTRIAVGNLELMKRLGVEIQDSIIELLEEIASRGHTPVLVAIDDKIHGVFEIGDEPRAEAEMVISELKKIQVKTGVLSGDSNRSVEYYSRILGLDIYFSELKPDDKANIIQDLQLKGEKIVYVGDGVNDAPAISAAYVGVAMGSGSEISREAGDVVLTRSKLEDLLYLFEISRIVKRKSIQNLAWAFIYNAVLIPIATGLLYPSHGILLRPEFAAIAMVLSNITVVLNAVTLLRRS